MKKMIACLLTLALALTAVCALAEGSLTFSWWGGDARHEATQQAVEAFKAATGIDVQCTYSALKNSDGVYYDAMDGLSYKDYSIEEAAEVLYEGITEVLAK